MGPLSCHRNIIVTLIIEPRKFAGVSLIAVFLCFSKKKKIYGFNQNDYCSMFSLLIGSFIKYVNKCQGFDEA